MYLATMTFARGTFVDHEAAYRLYSLVALLRDFGHVCQHEWMVVRDEQNYRVDVNLPARDALHLANWEPQALAELHRLQGAGMGDLEVVILGIEVDSRDACSCVLASSYILDANTLSNESPLRCGTCFGYVPLYRLERAGDFRDILSWQHLYRMFDTLYTVGVQERTAIQQLERLDSPLSQDGLKICRSLSTASGRPFYYNLLRLRPRQQTRERKRRCPRCQGPWLLDSSWHGRFDFRCDECCLLSNLPQDVPRTS